jgi:AcrR family transcriptional regulator
MVQRAKKTNPPISPPAVRGRPSARGALLDAAASLVLETGARRLTLEAVAARAGISKGGLLYHFPTKEDLLAAMVQRHIEENVANTELFAQLATADAGLGLKALVDGRAAAVEACELKKETASCLMAAAAERPALLEPVRNFHRAIWAAVDGGTVEREKIPALLLAWFALEGDSLLDMLDISPLTPQLKEKLTQTALALLEGRFEITEKVAP